MKLNCTSLLCNALNGKSAAFEILWIFKQFKPVLPCKKQVKLEDFLIRSDMSRMRLCPVLDPLSPDADSSNISDTEELRFHHIHGQNSTIANNGRTCLRPNATGEFNDAIIMSSRPLKDNELFEVIIEKMVDRWSGSLEAGVTLIKPEELEFPNTMTDIAYDTWMLR